MLVFVKNWQIDEEMTIDSDYKVEAEMIKSSLNSLYNMIKADWTKFAKELQQKLEKILNLIKNLNFSLKDLKNIVISFRNLIVDVANQHTLKRKSFIKIKVWWHDDLNALRKSLSLIKRNWKFNKIESNWEEVVFFKNKYFYAI